MTERTFGPAGGSGGEAFEAYSTPDGAHIAAVHVWSGLFVDSIQVVYRDAVGQEIKADRVGGHSGFPHVFTLDADEYLVGISGRCANYIDSLCLHTNKRSSESYGGWGGATDYSITAPAGSEIVGLFGRAGWYLDALGIVTRAQAAEPAETAAVPAAVTKPSTRKAKAPAEAKPVAVEAKPVEVAAVPAAESKPAAKKKPAAPKAKAAPTAAPVVEESVPAAPAPAPAVEESAPAALAPAAPAKKAKAGSKK